MPTDCEEDEGSMARLPGGWVAVLNYTEKLGASSGTAEECPGVIDRVSQLTRLKFKKLFVWPNATCYFQDESVSWDIFFVLRH